MPQTFRHELDGALASAIAGRVTPLLSRELAIELTTKLAAASASASADAFDSPEPVDQEAVSELRHALTRWDPDDLDMLGAPIPLKPRRRWPIFGPQPEPWIAVLFDPDDPWGPNPGPDDGPLIRVPIQPRPPHPWAATELVRSVELAKRFGSPQLNDNLIPALRATAERLTQASAES